MKCLFKRSMRRRRGYLSQRIHVSYIHLHLADFYATVNVYKYTIQESYGLCSLCRNSRKNICFLPTAGSNSSFQHSHIVQQFSDIMEVTGGSPTPNLLMKFSETRTWPLTDRCNRISTNTSKKLMLTKNHMGYPDSAHMRHPKKKCHANWPKIELFFDWGVITFERPYESDWGTLEGHFLAPRVAALFADLAPQDGGSSLEQWQSAFFLGWVGMIDFVFFCGGGGEWLTIF